MGAALKKLVSLVVAIAALGFANSANAADMPTKAPVVSPVYNWTGLYAGAVTGYGWGTGQHCETGLACLPGFPATDPKGWNGGLTLGYNWQLAHWVFGVEGDWSWGKLNGSSGDSGGFGCGGGGQTCDTWINSDRDSARPRGLRIRSLPALSDGGRGV